MIDLRAIDVEIIKDRALVCAAYASRAQELANMGHSLLGAAHAPNQRKVSLKLLLLWSSLFHETCEAPIDRTYQEETLSEGLKIGNVRFRHWSSSFLRFWLGVFAVALLFPSQSFHMALSEFFSQQHLVYGFHYQVRHYYFRDGECFICKLSLLSFGPGACFSQFQIPLEIGL